MKTYISGQITGLQYDKVDEKYRNAENELRKLGHEPVSPLNNGLPADASWSEHMIADINLLKDCDAIYMLPDWINSYGARIEKLFAEANNIKVMYQQNDYTHNLKNAISEVFSVKFSEIKKQGRDDKFIYPRIIYTYQMRKYVDNAPIRTFAKISEDLNKDHATVVYYSRKYDKYYSGSDQFRRYATQVERLMNANN